MKITFCGANQQVTGSRHLISSDNGFVLLLDCGMFQGAGINTYEYNASFVFNPDQVDAVILSHAHIDHTGSLPRLVKLGFQGKVYATPPTIELCRIMLMDSAFIQRNDIKYLNERRAKKKLPPVEPLYDESDVEEALKCMIPVHFNEEFILNNEFKCKFTDNAHIIGSAAVHILYSGKNNFQKQLTYTGDIGRPADRILRNPEPFSQSDYIICESTYGDRIHPENQDRDDELYNIVFETCIKNKGKLIIPAFSIDRTQELIYSFDRLVTQGKLPALPVYVDSPLSVAATGITRKFKDYYNPEILDYIKSDLEGDAFDFPNLKYISKVEESKLLNTCKEPCIIISASGMAEAGRIKHHIRNNIENPLNTILIVGYCTPDSLGGRLKNGDTAVKIFGEFFKVKARIEIMDGYSAHGDYNEIIAFLACQNPKKVKKLFLVHGEKEVQISFADKLRKKGFKKIHIPFMGETVRIQ